MTDLRIHIDLIKESRKSEHAARRDDVRMFSACTPKKIKSAGGSGGLYFFIWRRLRPKKLFDIGEV